MYKISDVIFLNLSYCWLVVLELLNVCFFMLIPNLSDPYFCSNNAKAVTEKHKKTYFRTFPV